MSHKFSILIVCVVALVIVGCSDVREKEIGKPAIFVSILPQAGLAKRIAGDHFEIQVLVDEGQSPHTYEPTPRQIAGLSNAKALLTIGIPFEKQLLKKITQLNPDLKIIETQAGIDLREVAHDHNHHGECTHGHGEKDPHVWLSPKNSMLIAENICNALIALDPENKADYIRNLSTLTDTLSELDNTLTQKLAPLKGSHFYVFHPSFGYFADAYGLKQIPVEVEGKSPSPRQLAQFIEQAKADGVKVIFVQEQFSADSAKAIADAIGGAVVQINPLAEDNIGNMQHIGDRIAKALLDE